VARNCVLILTSSEGNVVRLITDELIANEGYTIPAREPVAASGRDQWKRVLPPAGWNAGTIVDWTCQTRHREYSVMST